MMELRVGDAMTKGVIYVDPKSSVQNAAEIMKNRNIDSVIVMKNGEGAGIITERDIICKIVAARIDPKSTPVSQIMTSPLITIKPDADIDDAAKIMRDKDIRRLIVTNKGKIVGILTEFDVIRVEPALHTLIEEHSKWDITDISSEDGAVTGICEVCGNYDENLKPVDGRTVCEDCSEEE